MTGAIIDTVGTSLRNAFVSVTWSSGAVGTCDLNETPWATDNRCRTTTSDGGTVPAPGSLALIGLGMFAAGALRFRRA